MIVEQNQVTLSGFRQHRTANPAKDTIIGTMQYEAYGSAEKIVSHVLPIVIPEKVAEKSAKIPFNERVKLTGRIRTRKITNESMTRYENFILVESVESFHEPVVLNTVCANGYIRSKVFSKTTNGKTVHSFLLSVTEKDGAFGSNVYVRICANDMKFKTGQELSLKGTLGVYNVNKQNVTCIKPWEVNGVRIRSKENNQLKPTAHLPSVRIMSVDPGTTQSGYAIFDMPRLKLIEFGKVDNEDLLKRIRAVPDYDVAVIEVIRNYGNIVGKTVFDTCVWIGRFVETWRINGLIPQEVTRMNEKMNLVGTSRTNDKGIRDALIRRFAKFDLQDGKGTRDQPDVFFGVSNDVWQAIAGGVTYYDELKQHKR